MGTVSLSLLQSLVDRAKLEGLKGELVEEARERLRGCGGMKKSRFTCALGTATAGGSPHTNLWRRNPQVQN